MTRTLDYASAINDALHTVLREDEKAFILGQGVDNPWYVGTTAEGLVDTFGRDRVIDPPISENGMNGFAIGAAITGHRPIVIHPRLDFLLYGLDQLINQAANWSYMFRGQSSVPMVLWGIVNRGGEQGAQHSQAIQAFFNHVPGLKVVAPASPYDAKGLLISAVRDPDPVVYVDDRWLYDLEGEVPEEPYEIPLGEASITREGSDLSIVATSYMNVEARAAADELETEGFETEIVNVRSLTPLDEQTLANSVSKTGRAIVADGGWRRNGVASELSTRITELVFDDLVHPVQRITVPDTPAPSSGPEEGAFYPDADDIRRTALDLLDG